MGIWIINSQALELNLVQPLADRWHQEGLRFCWMKDNPTILDVNNDEYYTSSEDVKEDSETHRVLKEVVNVLDSCKKRITGHIIHWVMGPCSATPHRNWFIIRPK